MLITFFKLIRFIYKKAVYLHIIKSNKIKTTMKTHDNKTKTKSIWFDTRLRLWTLQNLDKQGNQIESVEYEVNRKNAFEWLKEENK